MKPYIQKGAQTLDDADALKIKTVYPLWEELVKLGSVKADAGYKFLYGKDLYACRDENPTFQEAWVPGIDTAALYTRIDETHAGTIDNPIPYSGNMALEAGKYYIQNDVIYLCTRDTGIPVYADLSALVGMYVEEVE